MTIRLPLGLGLAVVHEFSHSHMTNRPVYRVDDGFVVHDVENPFRGLE
jgi:hypothetical protein